MRIASRLMLLCAMALTALAMSAASATAQTDIEVVDEAEDPCDPCIIHARTQAGEPSVLTVHVFGHEEVISSCNDEFEGEIWHREDASEEIGHITSYINDHVPNQACTRVNCNGVGENPGESEWPLTNPEETGIQGGNLGHMSVNFCLDTEGDPDATGTHCVIEVDINESKPHLYKFTANANQDQCAITVGLRLEVSGEWFTEAFEPHQAIEIVHADDPQP